MKTYQVTVTTKKGKAPVGYVVSAKETSAASKHARFAEYAMNRIPVTGTEVVAL